MDNDVVGHPSWHLSTLCFADLEVGHLSIAIGAGVREADSVDCQVPIKVVLVASFAAAFGVGLFFLVQAITKLSGEKINGNKIRE